MAIDTTPSTVATNALQAIPFSSLIGGPLQACIQAQALAAKTSYEFINQVGLTIDAITGEKKAINITFQYNNNGQLTTLVCPLLVILPIPYLAINTVDIDFLANISASSSSVDETSSDTELGVDATAEASLGVGPFSLKVTAKANYSSKQHSKASSESKYSVEYTMGVKVSGGQTDMPAGLAAILNILQGSITSVSPGDMMQITPANMDFDQVNTNTLQVNVRTAQGIVVPGTQVKLTVIPPPGQSSPFESINPVVGNTPQVVQDNIRTGSRYSVVERAYNRFYGSGTQTSNRQLKAYHQRRLIGATGTLQPTAAAPDSNTIVGITDKDGNVIFRFNLKKSVFQGYEDISGKITISADIPTPGPDAEVRVFPETQDLVYNIIPFGPTVGLNSPTKDITFEGAAGTTKAVTITAMDGELLAPLLPVTTRVTIDGIDAVDTVFDPITAPNVQAGATAKEATAPTDKSGIVTFTYKLKAANTGTVKTGVINYICEGGIELDIPFKILINQ